MISFADSLQVTCQKSIVIWAKQGTHKSDPEEKLPAWYAALGVKFKSCKNKKIKNPAMTACGLHAVLKWLAGINKDDNNLIWITSVSTLHMWTPQSLANRVCLLQKQKSGKNRSVKGESVWQTLQWGERQFKQAREYFCLHSAAKSCTRLKQLLRVSHLVASTQQPLHLMQSVCWLQKFKTKLYC